ncbi:MAG: hypothetical protein JW744_01535 [Candidatus Diapherotrites archaeon]|uniref:Uncharacterized protein n=1 Tax=Candidatus Iainarchaeum sp. TaxID=3101447 RepID=A0A939C6Z8_9ARCH|nr:hypothetical protein [Candidatus Diapherotrites archaeon]
MKAKLKPSKAIHNPADKAWNEWFDKLDAKEHEKYLSQLGLDTEDIEEWEEAEGFKKPKPQGKSLKKKG